MDIAQSLDACEDDARTQENEYGMDGSAAPTAGAPSIISPPPLAFAADTKNLPYQTLRAQQRAMALVELPQRARCALASIALTVNCRKPLKEVFAHRQYLADRVGLSQRTWYRAEMDLVTAGLITIEEQKRKARNGRFGSAYIFLTQAAARLLGLIEDPAAQEAKPAKPAKRRGTAKPVMVEAGDDACIRSDDIANQDPASEQSDGCQEVEAQSALSSSDPTATVADPFTNEYLSPSSFQKRQQARLPEDVQPLVSLGFYENYVFKLMRVARVEHNKRLGDVVQACWENLKTAKDPIAYLLTLLRSSTDFTWLAKQRTEKARAKQRQVKLQADLERAREDLAGGSFENRDGTVAYTVSADGTLLTSRDVNEQCDRTAAGSWLAPFFDALKRGAVVRSIPRIIPACGNDPRVVEAFASRENRAKSTASTASVEAMRARLRTVLGGQVAVRSVA
ncbi:RepA replication protein [Burkholderia cenocepacia]|uniref:RepA replication protein n=1 Tax=Burkholderia cenocepacia TaxID=95486 RepID=UPI001B91E318|nr:RepA replication protein [Burkholderia cenocepacia]MBR8043156.1 RepA replication protein [Burkholderia cenocepacia]MBR8324474.1 RepA replication protein [Burkholderia cenocepacia]